MNPNAQHPGDYVFGEQLRQDRTGTVYRAVHVTSKNQVAIKILDEKYAGDPDLLARLQVHAGALGRVQHSGIVQILDQGQSAHGLYVVMENLAGETLADRLKREGKLPLEETLRIVGATASALAAAHRRRIVHRALTPESVFLADLGADGHPGGVVKILDLGLAKLLGDQAAAARKGVDKRADIQAVGRLAYQMLSGQLPLPEGDGDSGPVSEPRRPARLSAHGVTVPGSVEAAILKALDRRKKRRFSSMTEFAQALGVPITPAPLPTSEPELEIEPEMELEVDLEAEAEAVAAAAPAAPPPPPPALPLPPMLLQPASPRGGVVSAVGEVGRAAIRHHRKLAVLATASAAAIAIGWFALRSGGPSGTLAVVATTPPPARVDVARAAAPSPGLPTTPSRVDEILALNQKAVSAHEQSDFKTARALLQDADKLALASGYADAPVRAQTQVRLGALYVAQKNPRVGRRYLAKAVAINPAVRLPPGMMSPQAHKALIATKQKARLAKNGPPKRGAKSPPPRRHGRDLKQTR
jgi:serine/threonine-protein kinase